MGTIRYARKCTATGKGINEGFCYKDGDKYFAKESDFAEFLRNLDKESNEGLSDEFLIKESYDAEEHYWTQWDEVDEDEWFDINGEKYSDLNTHLETEVWAHKGTGEEFAVNIEIVRSL